MNIAAMLPSQEAMGARRRRLLALLAEGKADEAWPLWCDELAEGASSISWAETEIERAMARSDFALLGHLGNLLARYRWGSRWHPARASQDAAIAAPPRDTLTVTKLRHDAGQFRYLRQLGLLQAEFDSVIAVYERLAERLFQHGGAEARTPLQGEDRALIGHVYNRIVHLHAAPRVTRALSDAWSAAEVEARFLEHGSGVVVIDDFLTPDALAGVRRFAMRSTVWSGIRYARGRLGAFFNDGFNCPLLLQIAEELQRALPRVITPGYPIRQIWGFKNARDLPPDANLHADFAAVNVNFWLTPDDSNRDPSTGGMMVYDVDAPLAWDFNTYNGRTDLIKAFLRENRARETYIPYRANRCILFNSDLFHGTHEVHFKPGFEHERINVTMLYGHREDDAHHASMASRPDLRERWGTQRSGWRSPAFARHRV